MNLLGHDKAWPARPFRAAGRPSSGQTAGPGFPQVGLEAALLAALRVHVGRPGNAPLSGEGIRRLLGYAQTSGDSVRLLVGLQMYGLVERGGSRGKAYLLTAAALHLLETADRRAFQTGLRHAANMPALLREVLAKYGTDLGGPELQGDLRTRRLPENDRRTLVKVLRDNQGLLGQTAPPNPSSPPGQTARADALFEQVARHSPARRPADRVWARPWLRSLPGRTANLTLAAVVFVVSLVGAALLPGRQRPATTVQPPRADSATRQAPVSGPAAVTVSLPATVTPSATVSPPTTVPSSVTVDSSATVDSVTVPAPVTALSVPENEATGSARPASSARDTAAAQTAGRPETRIAAQSRTRSPAQARLTPDAVAQASAAATLATAEAAVRSVPPAAPGLTTDLATDTGRASGQARPAMAEAQDEPARGQTAQAQPAQIQPAQIQPAQIQPARNHTSGPTDTAALSSLPGTAPLDTGRRLSALLYSQRLTRLWKTFSPGVQKEWGGFAAFRDYRLGGLDAYGAETRVVSEEVRQSGGVTYYVRTATFERGPPHDWTLILGLDRAGQVVAFNIVAAGVLPGLIASAEH